MKKAYLGTMRVWRIPPATGKKHVVYVVSRRAPTEQSVELKPEYKITVHYPDMLLEEDCIPKEWIVQRDSLHRRTVISVSAWEAAGWFEGRTYVQLSPDERDPFFDPETGEQKTYVTPEEAQQFAAGDWGACPHGTRMGHWCPHCKETVA